MQFQFHSRIIFHTLLVFIVFWFYLHSPAIRCRIRRLSDCSFVHPSVCVCGHVLKACEYDNVETACGNFFIKFINYVPLGTKIKLLDFEVKRSEVKVTVKVTAWPNVVR